MVPENLAPAGTVMLTNIWWVVVCLCLLDIYFHKCLTALRTVFDTPKANFQQCLCFKKKKSLDLLPNTI